MDFDGGQNIATSESVAEDLRGYARAFVDLDPTGITPQLTSCTFVKDQGNNVAMSKSIAITGYTYNGAQPASFVVDVNLHGYVHDPLNNATEVRASVYVFASENFVYTPDLGALLWEIDTTVKDGNEFSLDGGQQSAGCLLAFTAEPGETFYLWEGLYGHAAFADATVDVALDTVFQDSHRLTRNIPIANFQDFANLAKRWGDTPCHARNDWCDGADLDQLGDVSMNDVLIFFQEWLHGCPLDWPLK
ncbi:MAG: hypothetical protein ACYTBJ_11670 [Planctomycetota bacterium]